MESLGVNATVGSLQPSFILPRREVAILTLSVAALAGMSLLTMFVCKLLQTLKHASSFLPHFLLHVDVARSLLLLFAADILYRRTFDKLPMKHGTAYMLLLIGGMICGQAHLLIDSMGMLFGRGTATCPAVHLLIVYHFALILFPVMCQMGLLWLKLRVREPHIDEPGQRKSWTRGARKGTLLSLLVLTGPAAAYFITSVDKQDTTICSSDLIEVMTTADSVVRVTQLATWIVMLLSLLVSLALWLTLSVSRFIPLYGDRWVSEAADPSIHPWAWPSGTGAVLPLLLLTSRSISHTLALHLRRSLPLPAARSLPLASCRSLGAAR